MPKFRTWHYHDLGEVVLALPALHSACTCCALPYLLLARGASRRGAVRSSRTPMGQARQSTVQGQSKFIKAA